MLYVSKNIKENAEELISASDRRFDEELKRIAHGITAGTSDGRQVKFITLCGPSCAGKTTTSKKLVEEIEASGRRIHAVSIDDYYLPRDLLEERAGENDIDLESPHTINTDDLALTLGEIFAGKKEIKLPVFDFESGKRNSYRTINVSDDDVFIFEGIQAMYENVSVLFKGYPVAGVFINVMQGINAEGTIFAPNRIRLMRRLVRDFYKRGADAQLTFELWKNVRKNEDVNIFPMSSNADYVIDSVMPYELGILKNYINDILDSGEIEDRFAPVVEDIVKSMEDVTPIPVGLIGKDSLYNEFVGFAHE